MFPKWNWPDARGWIGIGIFITSWMLIWMMKDQSLREDEFFKTITTVIISNGLMAVVAWAYSATKGGGELAERNATIVERNVAPNSEPQEVVVTNAADEPVPTTSKGKTK